MSKLNWKIGIACFTFFIGTLLTLVWFTLEYKKAAIVKVQPIISTSSVSEVKDNETTFEKKTSATKNVDSKNKTKDTDFNPPIRLIKNGGKYCEKYILRKIALKESDENKLIKLKNFNPHDESLSANIKKWLGFMRIEDLEVSKLKNNKQEVLLLSLTALAATGLSTSLENWHIEIDNFYSGSFWSFSKNPKLVFWDKKGMLNYYSVVYSDDFLSATSKRENLTFNIEHYRVFDGKTELIKKEINLSCK